MRIHIGVVVLIGLMLCCGGCKDSGISSTTDPEVPPPQLEIGKWRLIGLENDKVSIIATDPIRPNIIYAGTASDFSAGTRGKIFKTTDWGQTWTPLVHEVSPYVIVLDPRNRYVVYAGLGTANFTRPGIIKSTDGGITWNRADSGIDFGVEGINLGSLAIDPRNSSVLYAGTGGIWPGSVYKSTNAGMSWIDLRQVGTGPAVGALHSDGRSIAIDPRNSNVVYVGTQANLLKTTDAGLTWNYTAVQEVGVPVIVLSRHVTERIFFVSQYGFTRSDDGGQTYQAFNSGLPSIFPFPGGPEVAISSIVEHPLRADKLFITAFTRPGHDLYHTNNWGESWSAFADSSINRYTMDLKMTCDFRFLVAGTNGGVYLIRIQ